MADLRGLLADAAGRAADHRAAVGEAAVFPVGRPGRRRAGRARPAAGRGAETRPTCWPSWRRRCAGAGGHDRSALLRLRDRRRARRGDRGRRAGRRLGPAGVQRGDLAGGRRGRGGGRRAGSRSCSACRPAPRSASSPAHRGRTPSAWPRPGTTCWPTPAGTSSSDGLAGAPPVRVVATAERHATIDRSLRLLGLGAGASSRSPPTRNGRDRRRRRCRGRWPRPAGPTIVCLQAGNVNTGACDDLARRVDVAHEHGAWVHVDGAFGLWAAASPSHPAPRRRARARPTRGPPTVTSGSTCPTTAGTPSAPTRRRTGRDVLHRRLPDRAGRGRPARRGDFVPESSRRARGLRDLGGAARARPHRRRATWSTGAARWPAGSPRGWPRRRRRRCQRRRAQPGARPLRRRRRAPTPSSSRGPARRASAGWAPPPGTAGG